MLSCSGRNSTYRRGERLHTDRLAPVVVIDDVVLLRPNHTTNTTCWNSNSTDTSRRDDNVMLIEC